MNRGRNQRKRNPEDQKRRNERKRNKTLVNTKFLQMIREIFNDSNITKDSLPELLFSYAGFKYNPETFNITEIPQDRDHPSKFQFITTLHTSLQPMNTFTPISFSITEEVQQEYFISEFGADPQQMEKLQHYPIIEPSK